MSKRRRSNRNRSPKKKDEGDADDDEKDQDVDLENGAEENGYCEVECKAHLKSAWEMVEETHSSQDFTPFIAMFYYSMQKELADKEGYGEGDLTRMVANAFHLKQDQVFEHLSEFLEIENERKKKRKN